MKSSQVLNSQGDGRPHGYRVGSQPKEVRIMCCINSAVCAGAVPSQTPLKHVLLLLSLWHKVQDVLGTFVEDIRLQQLACAQHPLVKAEGGNPGDPGIPFLYQTLHLFPSTVSC